MAFPLKFKPRLELTLDSDLDLPTYAWLTYCVCGCEPKSCGWEGWILESLQRKKKQLSIDSRCKCPYCDRDSFRTSISIRFTPSKNQKQTLVPGVDYEEMPMQYDRRTKEK
jgi:hypothetical protein